MRASKARAGCSAPRGASANPDPIAAPSVRSRARGGLDFPRWVFSASDHGGCARDGDAARDRTSAPRAIRCSRTSKPTHRVRHRLSLVSRLTTTPPPHVIFRARSGGGFFGGAEQKPPEAGFFGGALEADGEELGGDLEDDPSTLQLDQVEEVDIPSSRDMGDIFASTLSIADTEVSSYLTHQPPSRTNLVRPQDLMGAATAPRRRSPRSNSARRRSSSSASSSSSSTSSNSSRRARAGQTATLSRPDRGDAPRQHRGPRRRTPHAPSGHAPRHPPAPSAHGPARSPAGHPGFPPPAAGPGGPSLPARGRAWAWARLLPTSDGVPCGRRPPFPRAELREHDRRRRSRSRRERSQNGRMGRLSIAAAAASRARFPACPESWRSTFPA